MAEQSVGLDDMELWTVPQVAFKLQFSEPTIWRMVKSGELPSVKVGRSRRIAPEDVADWKAKLRGAA